MKICRYITDLSLFMNIFGYKVYYVEIAVYLNLRFNVVSSTDDYISTCVKLYILKILAAQVASTMTNKNVMLLWLFEWYNLIKYGINGVYDGVW